MSVHFFRNRHTSEEQRRITLKFLELEDELDRENMLMLESMSLEHASKANIKRAISSLNVKHSHRLALRKRIAREAISPYGRDRTWIKS